MKTLKEIPEGMDGYTFNDSLYAKFNYVGQHHYLDINQENNVHIRSVIEKFFNCEYDRKFCLLDDTHFVKVYGLPCDENFCQIEWFTPIKKKLKMMKIVNFKDKKWWRL